MNKLLVALGALMAGALLIPDVAEAQRGGRGGVAAAPAWAGAGSAEAAASGVAEAASEVAASVEAPGCIFRAAA